MKLFQSPFWFWMLKLVSFWTMLLNFYKCIGNFSFKSFFDFIFKKWLAPLSVSQKFCIVPPFSYIRLIYYSCRVAKLSCLFCCFFKEKIRDLLTRAKWVSFISLSLIVNTFVQLNFYYWDTTRLGSPKFRWIKVLILLSATVGLMKWGLYGWDIWQKIRSFGVFSRAHACMQGFSTL